MKIKLSILNTFCLIATFIILELHEEIEWFDLPGWLYMATYYLRAIFSIFCVYLGVEQIKNNNKVGYVDLIIGSMFLIISAGPSMMSLYIYNSIELNLLSPADRHPYEIHRDQQKVFLLTIAFVSIFLALLSFKRKKLT